MFTMKWGTVPLKVPFNAWFTLVIMYFLGKLIKKIFISLYFQFSHIIINFFFKNYIRSGIFVIFG